MGNCRRVHLHPQSNPHPAGIGARYDGWTGRVTQSFMVGPMNPTGGAYGPGSPSQDLGNVDPRSLYPENYQPNFGIGGCIPCGGIGGNFDPWTGQVTEQNRFIFPRGIGRKQQREITRQIRRIERRRAVAFARGW